MKTALHAFLSQALSDYARTQSVDLAGDVGSFEVEDCKNPDHGDLTSNIALKYSKKFAKNPRELAQIFAGQLQGFEGVTQVEIAGPGFINLRLNQAQLTAVLKTIIEQKERFGCGVVDKVEHILLEFVSANPTGPLHVGHGRGAAYGDALARLLRAGGHKVDTEYYVNDAGRQMDILTLSVYWRYMQLCGFDHPLPKGIYQGDYIIDMAKILQEENAKTLAFDLPEWLTDKPCEWSQEQIDQGVRDKWIDSAIADLKNHLKEGYEIVFALALRLGVDDIREDLEEFNVSFDRWFSERSLYQDGSVEKAVEALAQKGLVYEKNGALWFKSSEFGDEKDRVVKRDNGIYTYFASDIAYHENKYQRGVDKMIAVWGADHHGYLPRVRAAMQAMGNDTHKLVVAFVQFAVLYKDGAKMQMSTRSGEFVTLRELREQVGSDAARFFYIMRKPEQHLDFDLDLAVSHSKDNPFYYVEYAHARTCRVLERAQETGIAFGAVASFNDVRALTQAEENALLGELRRYPEVIAQACAQLAPHMVVNYLKDLATAWHQFYDAGHKVLHEDEALRNARLLLTLCVQQVLRNGLAIIGVAAKERM